MVDGKFPSSHRVTDNRIYHHASETVRSPNPAGGEVPRDQYSGKTPRTPSGGTNQTVPLDEARGDRR